MPLGRQQIVDTALEVLNEVGIDELSTRRLAQRLGVQQPALYWHFKNKHALFDAMNAEILKRGHTHRSPDVGEPWDAFLLENARSFRAALMAFRDGARVHAGNEPAESDLPGVEAQLRCLLDAGFPQSIALYALVAIGNFVVGTVLEQQADADRAVPSDKVLDHVAAYPLLRDAIIREMNEHGREHVFEAGIGLIIDGLRTRLARLGSAT